jgi:putative oxidoreductase
VQQPSFWQVGLTQLILRLCLAAIFIYHGLGMISPDTEYGLAWQEKPYAEGKLPEAAHVGRPLQAAIAWGQLLGGVAVAIGFLPRLAALGLIAIMAGAMATVHWPHGFNIQQGGYEYNVAVICLCLGVVLLGGGPIGVGRWFGYRKDTT